MSYKVPSSEAYRNDPNVLINGFGLLSKVDGLESLYFGLQLEDPKTAYVFNNWTTRAHHQRLIESPSYRKVLEPMGPAFEGPSTITHVQFASDVTVAFKQPVTEITIHTANNPKDRQKVLELFAEFAKSRNGLATYGALEEKDDVTVFISGWLSVEETVKAQHLDSIIAQLLALGTADIKHVKLTHHSL
ncbi:hypothetical protein PILCRDRAFT_820970 [Piloderma croceum F 1598]|uniref:ABM domain-containing protein n=1 Tax=Piloderma croceum (strain F 1598) TaxID=765440 RepID=A0A0C3FS95_PILCF|nr:hypothetical protein PILCRDRAFT_820970 [Piloderma croceum F 1598]